ncbi:flavin reductase family protein [Paracoccaceae bacterium GXU_MW_L88]
MMDGFSSRDLRDALGQFATGVTVVTTQTPDGPLGMTVNSFAAVSLEPPLVLWSPARASDRFESFEAASHFAIHVLGRHQEHLAVGFAQSGHEPFAALETRPGLGDVPILDGCCARFECVHAAQYEGGDHLIMVGEVKRLEIGTAPPLIFHRGAFGALPDA